MSSLVLEEHKNMVSAYKFQTVFPNTSNVVILGPASTQSFFQLPAEVFNFYRSRLMYDVVSEAPTEAGYAHVSKSHIREISLKTTEGEIDLISAQNNDIYTRVIPLYVMSMSEYMSRDPVQNNLSLATSVLRICTLCAPCKVLGTTAFAAETPNPHYIVQAGTESLDNYTIASGVLPLDSSATQHLQSGGAATEVIAFSVSVPLWQLCYDSFFGIDKSWYFAQLLNLVITWSPVTTCFFEATASTDPVGGAGPFTTTVNLNNVRILLAVEKNENVRSKLASELRSGKVWDVPWLQSQQLNLGVATSSTLTQNLTRGMGSSLLRVYSVFSNANNTGLTAGIVEQVNDVGITSIQTSLDNSTLQDRFISIGNGDAYAYQYETIKGCAISGNRTYLINFVWIDNFVSELCSTEFNKYASRGMGIELDSIPLLYNVSTQKTAVNQTQTSFFVLNRKLRYQGGSFSWV